MCYILPLLSMQTNYLYRFNQKQIAIPEFSTTQHQQGKPHTLTEIFPDKAKFTHPKPLHFPSTGEPLTLSNN